MRKNLLREPSKDLNSFIKELKSGYYIDINKDHQIYLDKNNQNLRDFDEGFLSYKKVVFPLLVNNFSNQTNESDSENLLFSLGSYLPQDLATKLLSNKTFLKYEVISDLDNLLFFLKNTNHLIDNGYFKLGFDRYIKNFSNIVNNNTNYLVVNLNTIDISKIISTLEYINVFDEIFFFEYDMSQSIEISGSKDNSIQYPGIKVPFNNQSEFLEPILDCLKLKFRLLFNEKNYSFYKISRN